MTVLGQSLGQGGACLFVFSILIQPKLACAQWPRRAPRHDVPEALQHQSQTPRRAVVHGSQTCALDVASSLAPAPAGLQVRARQTTPHAEQRSLGAFAAFLVFLCLPFRP